MLTVWLQTFDALGTAAYGRRGRALVYMTAYWAVAGAPALLQLTSASSLQQILAPWGWTHWQAGLLVLGVIILLGQVSQAAGCSWQRPCSP